MNFKQFILLLTFFPLWAFAQETGMVTTESGQIAYQKFGSGYPVLIINGGPGMNSKGFASLAKMLSGNNTTIIYDQRGTGDSKIDEVNSENMTMELMVKDIERLREHLGYEQWIVLGHSFGGMLAYEYAAKHPEKVKAMIQSHSGGLDLEIRNGFDLTSRLNQIQRDSLGFYSEKIRRGDSSYETALKRAKFLAPAYLYDPSLAPTIAPRLTQANMMINSYVWNDLERIQFDHSEEMREFNKPVLILNGDNEVAPISIAKKAHAILPESKLVVMPECGHYGWLERPEIYLKEVKDFLKENSTRANY